jgi:hypothetical protein
MKYGNEKPEPEMLVHIIRYATKLADQYNHDVETDYIYKKWLQYIDAGFTAGQIWGHMCQNLKSRHWSRLQKTKNMVVPLEKDRVGEDDTSLIDDTREWSGDQTLIDRILDGEKPVNIAEDRPEIWVALKMLRLFLS